jgi:predicted nuclease of restriction endonuclease-like (RecB) superfamily
VKKALSKKSISQTASGEYGGLVGGIAELLEAARRTAARTVNALMTATYWEIGRRIVEFEQRGAIRAGYGEQILSKLSHDLTARFGRGFGVDNLELFRAFHLTYPIDISGQRVGGNSESPIRKLGIGETPQSISESSSRKFVLDQIATTFPLSWTHYIHLIRRSRTPEARRFYETEALRGGWSVRQLDRQIASQFYERTLLSRDKAAMLRKAGPPEPGEAISANEEVRDPFILEFLGLKDEYSETDLEEALLRHLENFLLELGGDFAFIGRQRRLRIGDEWYRVDLLFFHRKLRCLVVIDLKVGKFTHADAGQMHLYLNYAREHWKQPDENPPVGLILCAEKDDAIAKYALEGLPNKVLAREYKLALPDEKRLAAEIEKTRARLERHGRK